MRNKSVFLIVALFILSTVSDAAELRRHSPDAKPKKPAKVIVVQCFDDDGNPIPCNDDPGTGGGLGSCKECVIDRAARTGECISQEQGGDPNWNPCNVSWICQSMPGGGQDCFPDCGGQRCYSI